MNYFIIFFLTTVAFAGHDLTKVKTRFRAEKNSEPTIELYAGVPTEAAEPEPDGQVWVKLFPNLPKTGTHFKAGEELYQGKTKIGRALKTFEIDAIWDQAKGIGMMTGLIPAKDLDPSSLVEKAMSDLLKSKKNLNFTSTEQFRKKFGFKDFDLASSFKIFSVDQTLAEDISPGLRLLLVFDAKSKKLEGLVSSRKQSFPPLKAMSLEAGRTLFWIGKENAEKAKFIQSLNMHLKSVD